MIWAQRMAKDASFSKVLPLQSPHSDEGNRSPGRMGASVIHRVLRWVKGRREQSNGQNGREMAI